MNPAYHLAGIIRQQRDVNRVGRHQFGDKGFHSCTGEAIGIGERNIEKVVPQRIPERRIPLLVAAPAQLGEQMR